MDKSEQLARRLKPRDLHALAMLAEVGSMARAASLLGLSQSAISKTIADLEDVLGVRLLDRNSRGVELTAAGERLMLRGRIILDELTQTVIDVTQFSDPEQGEIRIATTEPMTTVVSEIIQRLQALHPRISYDVIGGDTDRILQSLRQREVDIVITRALAPVLADDLEVEPLFEAPLAVLAAKTHALAGRKGLGLADVCEERWTHPPSAMMLYRLSAGLFETRGLNMPKASVVTDSIYMRLNLLATGQFLTILPPTMLRHPGNRDWLTALQIDLPESRGLIAAIRLKQRWESGALRAFRDAARLIAKEIGPDVRE